MALLVERVDRPELLEPFEDLLVVLVVDGVVVDVVVVVAALPLQ